MLFKRRRIDDSETKNDIKRELECENAIIQEKNDFGKVRKHFMAYMRAEYGHVADRTLYRVNKRRSRGRWKRG